MSLSRRRLLALGLAMPLAAVARPVRATPLPALRDIVRAGIQRDPGGALVSIFDLPPETAAEVLLKATRDDALPEGYQPADLVNVRTHGLPANGQQVLRALIVDDTRALIAAGASVGLDLYVGSGFRSAAYQAAVFRAQTSRWGDEDTANRYSARPGYSQHQLGTTLDLTVSFRAFRESDAPAWLRDNAHQFGFVLPYTAAAAERTGYVDEPWHARWVGPGLATALHAAGYHEWTDVDADDAIAMVRAEAGLDRA